MCAARRNRLITAERNELWGGRCGVLPALASALALSVLLLAVPSCGRSSGGLEPPQDSQGTVFQVESLAFKAGGEIPKKFTCEGEDISPALRWTHPPRGTQSFALIAEDPDAPSGTWVHWVVYDLPGSLRELPDDVPKQRALPGGGAQGRNDFGRIGYGGPCPPPGSAHHYFFKLYALGTTLRPRTGATKEEVLKAARGHILGVAQFVALFKR